MAVAAALVVATALLAGTGRLQVLAANAATDDTDKPLVTYPGFRMLPDGSSVVWLSVTEPVPIESEVGRRSARFLLKGARVGVKNNLNPLITTHFPTPLERAQLVREKAGAALVLKFREDVEITHRSSQGPDGVMLLEVPIPRRRASGPSASSAAGHP